MKKIFLCLLCSIFIFGITGCGSNNKESDSNQEKQQEDTKINLNDNIEVTINTKSTGLSDCFFYMFATNLEEIFPNAQIENYNNYRSVAYWVGPAIDATENEITEEGLQTYISSLNFNTEQENKIIDLFNKYQNGTYKGIKKVEYTFNDHRLRYTYYYLDFNSDDYQYDGEIFDSKVQEILLDAIEFRGTCGGFDEEKDTILTEELCDEYNLSCDRW